MPLVMTDEDKATVKRTIPKPANKIFAVAVAKLYVAHPNKQRWTFTGLQGAAVLAEDHVGHTLWIKLVDISQSNRGILWDQEIYDTFHYNQDRTFFHTFELENCLAGLSFVDEKEAKTFKKKMDDRESKASKATKATTFGSGVGGPGGHTATGGKSRFGIGSLLPGHRSSSGPHNPPPLYESSNQSLLPSQDFNRSRASSGSGIDLAWRPLFHELRATGMSEGEITKLFRELKDMGIKDEDIETQGDFVKEYVLNQAAANNQAMGNNSGSRPPAPPPPPPGGRPSISPQNTGSTTTSRRGPAPPPPPTRRSQGNHLSAGPHSPDPGSPDRESSPPRGPPAPRFRAPPPLADAGRFANTPPPAPPRSQAAASGGGPPPPPRPPKTPMEDEKPSRFGVPPPFQGERIIPSVAPPPPSRASAPAPSLPVRDRAPSHSVPPATNNPPPLPPKTPHGAPPPAAKSIAPPMPSRSSNPPLAPPLPSVTRPIPPPPSSSGPPPPPPMPSISGPPPPPPMPSSSGPPPPPPMPSSSGPPPPPPMPPSSSGPPAPPLPPGRDSGYISAASSAPPLPAASGDKADVMASIRASGGIGGGVLKKVDPSQRRDRSAAIVAGGSSDNAASGGSGAPPPPAAGGGSLADTLAQALKSRKSKVSQSDDEDDDDSDWDDTPKAKTKR